MKLKFQNKRELFLIHEDSEKQGFWAEPGWENQDVYHSPSEPAWEDWEIHDPPTEPVEDDQKIPDFITNTIWEGLEIIYPTPEDPTPALSTPPKKTKVQEEDVIVRYYFSRYGRNDINLTRYGERSCFLTLTKS